MILHLHQGQVDGLDVAQGVLAIGDGGLGLGLVARLWTLDVEERSRCLGVAEGNLSQTAFDNELLRLGPSLCSLDCALDLLFHTLHVVVTTSAVPSVAEPVVGLEEVRLGELVCWLLGVLAWSAPNLTEDLVVEVLRNGSLWASFVEVASRCHELLQLNAGDEVLVLGCHQAIVLGQLSNLVVTLRTFGIFLEESCTVCLGQVEQLLWVSNDRERRAPVVLSRSTSSHLPWSGLSGLGHWLALTRQTVGVLQDLSRLGGRRGAPLLLCSLLWLLALQNGRLLRRWRLCRLAGEFSVELLLLLLLLRRALPLLELLLLRLRRLLELLLLRTLQDLRDMLGRETRWHARLHTDARHAGERRWLVELLRVLLRIGHARRRLRRGRSSRFIANALAAHHGLDLVQAHHLPRAAGLGGAAGVLHRRRVVLGLLLALGGGLLRLQAPDVGAGLELGDVLGVLVALVAGAGGLWLGRRLSLLLLGRGPGEALAGLVEHLLLLHGARDLGCLAGKVKVLADVLLRGRAIAAERVVVEGVVGVVELAAEALVGLLEVDAVQMVSGGPLGACAATYTSSSTAPPLKPAKASCWPKPGALVWWPRSRGRLGSKPKKDMVGGARAGDGWEGARSVCVFCTERDDVGRGQRQARVAAVSQRGCTSRGRAEVAARRRRATGYAATGYAATRAARSHNTDVW